jgi:hypothetical protein
VLAIAVGAGCALASQLIPGSSSGTSGSVSALATGTSSSAASIASAAAPYLATATATTPSTAISLPSSADGQLLLNTANATAEAARVRTGVAKGGAVYTNVLVGAYGPQADGGYRLVLVDQAFTNLSATDQSQFEAYAPTGLVQTLVSGLHMSDVQVETSTDPGAALTCGSLTADGRTIPTCVWDDSRSFGFAYFYPFYFTTDLPSAARYTDALRAAAER